MEIYATELETKSSKLIILSLHRVSTRDFKPVIMNLDDALTYLYKPKVEFLICGEKHTDYLNESNWVGRRETTSLIINNIQCVAYS